PREAPRARQGPGRLSRGARTPERRSVSRLDTLRERLTERLLVTDLTNVFYLTGFDSSNAALLVDPDGGAQLFTDFRYFEAAEQVAGVEAVLTKRALARDLAE